MTNTPQLERWSIDVLKNTQQHVHTERLEKRVADLEKRIEELERVFYEKVEYPSIDRSEVAPICLVHE